MRTIKLIFAVMLIAASFELGGTNTAQAKPAATFQHIAVRIGTGPRRPYYRRRVIVRRPYYRRWHRGPVWRGRPGWRRPYRRY